MFKKQVSFYLAGMLNVLLFFGFFGYIAKAAFVPTTGDNLGNHTATQNIQLNNNWLSGDGGNEGVFVNINGNVGVGITNPLQKLQVEGFVRSSDGFCIGTNCATTWDAFILPPGANNSTLRHNGSTWVSNANLYNTGNNIGIGITNPVQKLQVAGYVRGDTGFCIGANCITSWPEPETGGSGTVTSIDTDNGITGGPITTFGTVSLTGQASALHNLNINGLIARTGTDTVTARSIAVTGNGISVSNASGATGNPTITLTNNVIGSGASGYVPRWNSASSLINSIIYDNGTNIGVGTATPAQKLHSTGYVRGDSGFCIGTSCLVSWPTLPAGSSGRTLMHNGSTWVSNANLYNNGTNVGIGTATPAQKLHSTGYVRGDSGFCIGTDCITSWPSGSSGDDVIGNEILDVTNTTLTRSGSGTAVSPYTIALNLGSSNTWTGAQTFNSTTRFPGSGIWNTSGNVGIGTTAPVQKLQVAGYVRGDSGLCIGTDCRTTWPEPGGSGTVTAVDSGYGLTGGPITTSGSLSLDTNTILVRANSGTNPAAVRYTGTTQTSGYFYGGSTTPSNSAYTLNFSGLFRATQLCIGSDCRNSWPTSSSGTVTSIDTDKGITGGTITTSGTLSLTGQALALHNLSANGIIVRTGSGTVAARTITAGTGISVADGNGVSSNPTISADIGAGSTQVAAGDHIHNIGTLTATAYRTFYSDSSGNIQQLAHGSSGQVLRSAGLTDAPYWDTISTGSGTVTNISTNNGITGGDITDSGTIGLTGQALDLHNLQDRGLIVLSTDGITSRGIDVSGNGISITEPHGDRGDPTITLTDNVTGSGTANYVSKWSSNNDLTNSAIYDNGTNIGVGTATPAQKLHSTGFVRADSGFCIGTSCLISWPTLPIGSSNQTLRHNGSTWVANSGVQTNGSNVGIAMSPSASYRLDVNGTVRATEFIYTSDERLKENIKTITSPLEKISSLRGVSFDWKEKDETSIGLIAQEVENVFPELVSTDDEGYKSVKYGNLVAPLIEAVKEQQQQISNLESRIKQLEGVNKK